MEGPPMTFVFHHGGKFKTDRRERMTYEPDHTEVLMGVEADTIDVFFVKFGYYKELGYAKVNNCVWKDKNEGSSSTRSKMKRKYNPIRCMFCSEVGHNKRTCKKKKQMEAKEQARQMQLQLAVVTTATPAVPPSDAAPAAPSTEPHHSLPPPPAAEQNAPTELVLSQTNAYPSTQHTQNSQQESVARPAKLKVVKGRARGNASPQAVATSTTPFSAETIKGTSSATAKRLADYMTFVPTPGFNPPKKKDKPT